MLAIPAVVPAQPGVRDAANPAVPPRHVGTGAHAEPHHAATRLCA